MSDDAELLARYATDRSETAFTDLIHRHVDLVYSAALRLVNGDVHRAQDVTQQVFTELARSADRLRKHPALVGWLYTTTRLMALRAVRTEQRRQAREQEAHTMNELLREPASEPDWDHLRPVLEDAMHELSEPDRLAVLLRFFKNKSLNEVGAALGLSDNAARMRVDRALDKLRSELARKGVTSAAAVLASTLTGHAVAAAPAGLVATLTAASLAGATAGTGSTLTLLKLMSATKLKLGAGTLLVAGVAAVLIVQHQSQARLRGENESLHRQIAQLTEELSRAPAQIESPQQLPDEQRAELLRLRGEIGLLRRQLADAAKVPPAAPAAAAGHAATTPTDGPADALEQQKRAGVVKLNDARHYTLAFIQYADKNQGRFPASWDEVRPYFNSEHVGTPSGTTEFEIVQQGRLTMEALQTNSSSIILIREWMAWPTVDGKWAKVYGFADGHAEVRALPDGNFGEWEKDHVVSTRAEAR